MQYRVVGKDEKTGDAGELIVEAPDREAAFVEAARLGLIGEEAQLEALPYEPVLARPARYAGLRFCGYALIVLAWVQVCVGLVLMAYDGASGLITVAGFVIPMAFGCACLALRDIAISTATAD